MKISWLGLWVVAAAVFAWSAARGEESEMPRAGAESAAAVEGSNASAETSGEASEGASTAGAAAAAEDPAGSEASAAAESERAGGESPEAGEEESAAEALVTRSTFTNAVVDREPQDSVASLSNEHVQIFYFTELRDAAGETIQHRWQFDGQVIAEVPFEVGGPRWRVYSRKSLDPRWLGEWTVSVVDSAGRVLQTDSFRYTQATIEPESAPEAIPPAAPAD